MKTKPIDLTTFIACVLFLLPISSSEAVFESLTDGKRRGFFGEVNGRVGVFNTDTQPDPYTHSDWSITKGSGVTLEQRSKIGYFFNGYTGAYLAGVRNDNFTPLREYSVGVGLITFISTIHVGDNQSDLYLYGQVDGFHVNDNINMLEGVFGGGIKFHRYWSIDGCLSLGNYKYTVVGDPVIDLAGGPPFLTPREFGLRYRSLNFVTITIGISFWLY